MVHLHASPLTRQAHGVSCLGSKAARSALCVPGRRHSLSLSRAPISPIAKPGHSKGGHGARVAATAAAPATTEAGTLREPSYPTAKAVNSGYLKVSDIHTIYYEVHGNPHGVPAVVVHGGPGAGCYANHARFFDPDHYCIVLMDQRGCGRSTPRGCLQDNHTSALVEDLDLLRRHLSISQWLLLGGSWGVTLSLAYAQAHPQHVLGLILRGVCLMRPEEIQWMYGGGAAMLKPMSYQEFLAHLNPSERANPLLGYYKRLLSPRASVRDAAAQAWMRWEMAVGFSNSKPDLLLWDGQAWKAAAAGSEAANGPPPCPPPAAAAAAAAAAAVPAGSGSEQELPRGPMLPAEVLSGFSQQRQEQGEQQQDRAAAGAAEAGAASAACPEPWVWGLPVQGANLGDPAVQQLLWQGLNHRGDAALSSAQALLECHYSLHGAFLLEAPLLDHIDRIRHIPCIAVHGQMDYVCPPSTAFNLHEAWPEMELRLVPGAGHSMYDPKIADQLLRATDRMRELKPAGAAGAQSSVATAPGAR